MQALRPVASTVVRLWASHRLDVVVTTACRALVPGAAGGALGNVARLLVAARIARSLRQHRKHSAAAPSEGNEGGGDEDEEGEEGGGHASAALPPAGASSSASRPSRRQLQPAPKGLGGGGLPLSGDGGGMILSPVPPGGLGCCSLQPLGLPMMLVGQSATRAPLYAVKSPNRLVRGLVGLAATLLLCRAERTPFTGRLARLPPALFERLFCTFVGPAAAVSYLTASAAGQGGGPADAALCRRTTPLLQQLFTRLRSAGQAEAERGGRRLAFASDRPSVEAIQRSDVNACCLPGGIVFVHSGLIRACQGRHDSLAFVLGHEVGHAVGRHSLEKAAGTYLGLFGLDAAVGLAERLLRAAAPGADDEWVAARLKTLDGLLQSGLYLLQLRQSRRHEYEADELALALGSAAGMERRSLVGGATDVLQRFMKMEAGAGLAGAVAGAGADPPLSTHPAAVNRLRRLGEVVQRGAALNA